MEKSRLKRFGAKVGAGLSAFAFTGAVMAQDLATELAAAETEITGNINLVQGLMITVVIMIVSVGIVLSVMRRKGG